MASATGGGKPANGNAATELRWAEVTSAEWDFPQFTRTSVGLTTRFAGSCPRCGHVVQFDVKIGPPPLHPAKGIEKFTMYCNCGQGHPGHPDHDNSCGAYWLYESEL
jgi:hypothetical protein